VTISLLLVRIRVVNRRTGFIRSGVPAERSFVNLLIDLNFMQLLRFGVDIEQLLLHRLVSGVSFVLRGGLVHLRR